jgi:hypothetical protein
VNPASEKVVYERDVQAQQARSSPGATQKAGLLPMSPIGHSLPGRAASKPGHVRYAPKAGALLNTGAGSSARQSPGRVGDRAPGKLSSVGHRWKFHARDFYFGPASSIDRPLASASGHAVRKCYLFKIRKKLSALWPSALQRAGAGVDGNVLPFASPLDMFGPRLACPKRHRLELQPIPEKTPDHAQFLLSSGRFEHCHSLEDRAGCRWVF